MQHRLAKMGIECKGDHYYTQVEERLAEYHRPSGPSAAASGGVGARPALGLRVVGRLLRAPGGLWNHGVRHGPTRGGKPPADLWLLVLAVFCFVFSPAGSECHGPRW